MKRFLSALTALLLLLTIQFPALAARGISGSISLGHLRGANTQSEKAIAKKGSKGEKVKEIQQRLIDLGFLNDKADGSFGKNTMKAVEEFQKSQGLEITGEIFKVDYDALFAPEPTSTPEPTPEPTKAIDEYDFDMSFLNVESDYPKCFLAIGVTLPTGEHGSFLTDYYDFTKSVSAISDANEEWKYKKVPIEYLKGKETLTQIGDISYSGTVSYLIGETKEVTCSFSFRMADLFPEIYYDYDLIRAQKCWKEYLNYTSLTGKVSATLVGMYTPIKNEEYHYYVFTASNGINKTKVFAIMDSQSRITIAEYDGLTFYDNEIGGFGALASYKLSKSNEKIILLDQITGNYSIHWLSEFIRDVGTFFYLNETKVK